MSENWAEKSREKRAKVIVDTFADNCSEDRLDQLELKILRALELESNQLKAELEESKQAIEALMKSESSLMKSLEREREANAKIKVVLSNLHTTLSTFGQGFGMNDSRCRDWALAIKALLAAKQDEGNG